MNKISLVFKIISLLLLSFLLFSCNPLENDSNSASWIEIVSILGKDLDGKDGNTAFSDVSNNLPDTIKANLRANTLNPDPDGTSPYYDITLTGYKVTYTPTGSSTEVPSNFEGSLEILLPVGSTITVYLPIVQGSAKIEPPLAALVGNFPQDIRCKARIDFYGHDQVNHNVTKFGFIDVTFSDFPDPEPEPTP
ncbi:MAG: hypothetical protein PHU81_04700 [Acidobacteriota bacterium]|nr:hypothetical protein [Acidobacteriota bacterium]